MQLDYIDKINVYGDNIVRLYNFDMAQAIKFRAALQLSILKKKKPLDLSTLEFIKPRNCKLILRIAEEDQGISTEDEKNFFCDLTLEGYEQMIELLKPFCRKETKGYQSLYELDILTDFLFSPAGSWEE